MFMNDLSNRYTYLNTMKNVSLEEPTTRSIHPNRRVIINSKLEPVLDKLTSVRPTWRFKSTEEIGPFADMHVASRFSIYDGDESLGELWVERDWRGGDYRFYFDNFRLSKTKKRISYTSKPEAAVKRIVKAFHLKTPSERAAEAFSTIGRAVGEVTHAPAMALHRVKVNLQRVMFDYACHHWDEVKTYPAIDPTLDLPTLVQANHEAEQVGKAFASSGGVTVCIEANGSYLVNRRSDAGFAVEVFKDSTLSDHLRGSLGLLKLLDDANYIPDVGVRANAKLYFVLDKKEE
jgi:hypothetical protein